MNEAGEKGTPEPQVAPDTRQDDQACEPAETTGEELTPEQISELKTKADERDQYLDLLKRTKADFANYQKRVAEDRKKWNAVAERNLLTKLLSAADTCRVAATKSVDDNDPDSLRSALSAVWSELERFLGDSGVSPMQAEGAEFDPAKHQALHVEERDDVPDSTIIQEIVRGYEYGGDILRTAQVVVSKKPKDAPPQASDQGQSEAAADDTGTPSDESGAGE